MIEDWPFYIQQKLEPIDYDDSVKNDKDFDVSLKHYDYTEKYFSPSIFQFFFVFARFTCFPVLSTIFMFYRA